MPKQTFFNLDDDKREILIDALKKEFSRVNVHEASISNIVKRAGVPRGSFYQYFEDKEDAFLYVLESYGKINKEWLKAYLIETNGDLFETAALLFRRLLKNYSTKEHYQLFRHAFLNMNHKIEQAFTSDKVKEDMRRNMEELVQYVDYSILFVDTREELFHLLKIIKAVTFHNFIEAFAHQLSIDEACQQYQLELNMLKRGLLKTNDTLYDEGERQR